MNGAWREKKCLLKGEGEKKTKLSEMALEMPHFDRKFICFYAQCIMGFPLSSLTLLRLLLLPAIRTRFSLHEKPGKRARRERRKIMKVLLLL
jgi:hypothetical protein